MNNVGQRNGKEIRKEYYEIKLVVDVNEPIHILSYLNVGDARRMRQKLSIQSMSMTEQNMQDYLEPATI